MTSLDKEISCLVIRRCLPALTGGEVHKLVSLHPTTEKSEVASVVTEENADLIEGGCLNRRT